MHPGRVLNRYLRAFQDIFCRSIHSLENQYKNRRDRLHWDVVLHELNTGWQDVVWASWLCNVAIVLYLDADDRSNTSVQNNDRPELFLLRISDLAYK